MDTTDDLGDFSHPPANMEDEDAFLRMLLSDTPSALGEDGSSPDSSPPSAFEDGTSGSDESPTHWSQQLTPPVVPQISELSLELSSDLLFGTNSTDYTTFSLTDIPVSSSAAPITPSISPISPKEVVQPIQHQQIPLVPIVQPPIQPLPIVTPQSSQAHVQVPIVEPPMLRKNRASSKKRSRTEDIPVVPSPTDKVALPRDTLLQISSTSMEKYVETLQTSRQLSNDDQKELKRQKRLIKNRESAQLSRERKRAYIDQLEAKIAQLQSENSQLKNDNVSLRQSLARYLPDGIKTEPGSELVISKVDQQHKTKMGDLLTIGGSRATTATKAGVCLLIVLFSFGLFMNANKTGPSWSKPVAPDAMALPGGPVRFDPRSMVPQTTVDIVGGKRSLLEAFPEVKEEENDTDFMYESPAKFPKALPDSQIPASESSQARADRHVIHLTAGDSPAPQRNQQKGYLQRKLAINKAGVFTVSYSPEPVKFVEDDQHLHDEANSTYMLFLDPRPDLDDSDVENASAPVSATHETQLEVATPRIVQKDNPELPPMIISLVIPKHIANGSNPFAPEGVSPTDSLMEITCQVIDISITTSERPHN